MVFDVIAPNSLLAFESFVNVFDDGCKKSSGAGLGIEYLDFVNFLFIFAVAADGSFVFDCRCRLELDL